MTSNARVNFHIRKYPIHLICLASNPVNKQIFNKSELFYISINVELFCSSSMLCLSTFRPLKQLLLLYSLMCKCSRIVPELSGCCSEMPWASTIRTIHQVDILLLSETHFFNGHGFKLPNFHFYNKNTLHIAGHFPSAGTAILINRQLIYH